MYLNGNALHKSYRKNLVIITTSQLDLVLKQTDWEDQRLYA